jgi:predicted amidohydrolase
LLVVFPELSLSSYSNEDLFFQDALLDGVLAALAQLAQRTRELAPILVGERGCVHAMLSSTAPWFFTAEKCAG